MTNFFKKVARGSKNFFNKVGKDTSNFFKKDVPAIAGKVGGALEDAGRQTLDGLKKTGNFLEKNAGLIGDVAGAGLMASGFGAPLGMAVMAGGNVAQQAGGDLKTATSRIRQASNALGADLKTQGNALGKQLKSDGLQLKSQIRQGANQLGSDIKSNVRQAQSNARQVYNENLDKLNSNVGMAKENARIAISQAMQPLQENQGFAQFAD